jgi:hypothetical protein
MADNITLSLLMRDSYKDEVNYVDLYPENIPVTH